MPIYNQQAQALLEKLEELAPERVAEVEDFIDFLRHRQQQAQSLSRVTARLSEESFGKVWDNPDDAVYDEL